MLRALAEPQRARNGARARENEWPQQLTPQGPSISPRTLEFAIRYLAPEVGFEPTTLRLTAGCSTIELLRNWCGSSARARQPQPEQLAAAQ